MRAAAAARNVSGHRKVRRLSWRQFFETIEHAPYHCPAGYFGTKYPERDVSRFIEFGVVFELYLAVLSGRDAGGCFGLIEPVVQMIGVIATVRDHGAPIRDIWLKALVRLGNIGSVSGSQPQVNRATAAIADQMQLAVQPAFGLADAAPFAGVF